MKITKSLSSNCISTGLESVIHYRR